MTLLSGVKHGALLLALISVLLFAGCTQPAAVPKETPPPTTTVIATAETTPETPVNQALKVEVAAIAGAFASDIQKETLLAAMNEGAGSPAFTTVLGQLKALKAADPRFAFAYTLAQKDGSVRFIVDADYGMPNGSAHMEEYSDAPPELRSPVTTPIGVGPYTDQWGTFYSGFAPVGTGPDGTVLLVAIDIRA